MKYKLMSAIYNAVLGDEGNLLVSSPEHRVYSYETNLSSMSLGEKTLSEDFNNPLSPESIGYLVASDNATYEESLSCGAISLALGRKDINSFEDTNVISLIKNSYVSSKSDSDNLVNLSIFDLFCLTSSNKNSGAINSNCLTTEFFENNECETPLLINDEITTLASTINLSGIFYNESYLLDKEMLISSANLSACSCVNCDLETALLNRINLERFSRNNLLISIDISNFGNSLNSDSNSLGISISINLDRNSSYLNLSEFRKDSRFCEVGEIILKNFINSNSCPEQLQNLPNHDSCSLENRGSVTDFSVCNNVIINVNSHERKVSDEIFKSFDFNALFDNTKSEHLYLDRVNAEDYLEEDKESNSSAVFKTLTDSCFFNNFSSVHNEQLNFNANAKYGASFVCSGNNLQASGMNWQNSCSGNNLILSLKTDNTSENSASVLCALDSNSFLLLANSSRINSGAINSMFLDKNISLDDLFPFINKENSSLASITTSIYLHLLENLFDSVSLIFLPNLSASSCVNSLSFEKDSSILSCTIFFSNASLATSDQFITLNSDNSFFNSSEIAIVRFGILPPDTFNYINTLDTHVYKPFDFSEWISFSELKEEENIAVLKNHNEDNNLIKSSVVNTEIEDCSLKCLSLDQTGRFNFNASAKYAISFGSEILEEKSLISLEYSDFSINIAFSLSDLIAELKSIPDFFDNSSLCLYNSINAKSGANNLNENLENRELATLECLDNANNILASTTNFILDYNSFSFLSCSAIPLFTLRPISTDQSVNPLSSSCLSLFNISSFQANCLTLDSMQALTNPDQLISGKLFILSLTSSGIDKVIDTILYVEKRKDVELFKSFGSNNNVFFDKIISINQHSARNVYDLAILLLARGTMTGNLNLSANVNLTMNGGNQIGSNVTCVTIKGSTSVLEIC